MIKLHQPDELKLTAEEVKLVQLFRRLDADARPPLLHFMVASVAKFPRTRPSFRLIDGGAT